MTDQARSTVRKMELVKKTDNVYKSDGFLLSRFKCLMFISQRCVFISLAGCVSFMIQREFALEHVYKKPCAIRPILVAYDTPPKVLRQ